MGWIIVAVSFGLFACGDDDDETTAIETETTIEETVEGDTTTTAEETTSVKSVSSSSSTTEQPSSTAEGNETTTVVNDVTTTTTADRRRRFSAPTGLTWADLPINITMDPGTAPSAYFSSETPGVCSVTSGGTVDMPSPYDGIKGTCSVRIEADGTSDWDEVDEVLDIDLAGPPIVVRLQSAIDRTPDWPATNELTVVMTFSVTDSYNIGGVYATSDTCNSSTDETKTSLTVTLRFDEPAPCRVGFDHTAGGVYHVALDVPEPITIDPVDPPAVDGDMDSGLVDPGDGGGDTKGDQSNSG